MHLTNLASQWQSTTSPEPKSYYDYKPEHCFTVNIDNIITINIILITRNEFNEDQK